MRPAADPLKLGEYAKQAHNVYLTGESLDPLHDGELVPNPSGHQWQASGSLYRYGDNILGPALPTDFIASPIIEDTYDRVYFIHNDLMQFYPENDVPTSKPTDLNNGHYLGVPRPEPFETDQGAAIKKGDGPVVGSFHPDNTDLNYYDTSFVYTYVNRFGEEGPPSKPTQIIALEEGIAHTVDVSHVRRPEGYPDLVGGRIYMSIGSSYFRIASPNKSADNVSSLSFLISEMNAPDVIVTLSVNKESVDDLLISQEWDPPPTKMKHWIDLGNGMTVAADDHNCYFNVPFHLHAWTRNNRIKISDKILKLSQIDGGFAVLTDGKASVYQGYSPETMRELKLNFNHPITDPKSAINIDNGVSYATTDGVAFVSANNASILTDGVVSRKEWLELVTPSIFRCGVFEGRIVVMTRRPTNNRVVGYIFNLVQGEFTSFDLDESSLDLGFWLDPATNDLLYRVGNELYVFNGSTTKRNMLYETGDHILPHASSNCRARVESDSYPFTVTFNCDGRTFTKTFFDNKPTSTKVTGRKRKESITIEHNDRLSLLEHAETLEQLS